MRTTGDDFIFLASPLPNDSTKIPELRAKALRTHRRDGLLWRYNG